MSVAGRWVGGGRGPTFRLRPGNGETRKQRLPVTYGVWLRRSRLFAENPAILTFPVSVAINRVLPTGGQFFTRR
jgi:hypothetical protein